MLISGSSASFERLTQFRRFEPGLQTTAPEYFFADGHQQFHLVANSLVELLETARRELDVEPQQVVLGQTESADRCLSFYPAVRPVPIVAM